MAENKTKKTEASVEAFIETIADEKQRQDSKTLVAMMKKAAKCEPKMWGEAIIGFVDYHYKYASGREGDSFKLGFSPRKGKISIYFLSGFAKQSGLLEKLGKHQLGSGCLYIKRLADVDIKVLESLFKLSLTYECK